jgi:hypothetical protein
MTKKEYEVGFGKPPVKSRFKPGQSGNPKGRPSGAKNVATDLREELSERISLREGDRLVKVSKQRALLKALYAKAIKGDARAAALIVNLAIKLLAPEAEQETASASDPFELELLEDFLARERARGKEPTSVSAQTTGSDTIRSKE